MQKYRRLNKKLFLLIPLLVLLVIIIFFANVFLKNRELEQEQVRRGMAYLQSLEGRDVQGIKQSIGATKAKMNADLAETDEGAIWGQFENAVIIGDSRALGFSFHEFVPEAQVLAEGGGIITDVEEYLPTLQQLNPAQIYLCFGLNDIGIGYWPETVQYAAACDEEIQHLNAALPDTDVYLNSVLPAVGVGLNADPNYDRIGDYNEEVKAMCAEKGYHYIDNTAMAKEHTDLYQEDGLHVEKEFYKYWGANMLAGASE